MAKQSGSKNRSEDYLRAKLGLEDHTKARHGLTNYEAATMRRQIWDWSTIKRQSLDRGPLREKLEQQSHIKAQSEPLNNEEENLRLQDPRVQSLVRGTKT